MKIKTIKIIWHNGGELANQLWGAIGIYAYCYEKGYKCINNSFFFYKKYFKNIKSDFFKDLLFAKLFPLFFKTKVHQERVYRKLYLNIFKKFFQSKIFFSEENIYLPPSSDEFQEELKRKKYFHGWLFRNPDGIIKHREKIIKDIEPIDNVQENVRDFISPLREKYSEIIGVHIRQNDYKREDYKDIYYSPEEVADILKTYPEKENTSFVICSDEKVNLSLFDGLNVFAGPGSMMEDIFCLASCDKIIGSDSTFGAFASYYGNIPHIVFEKNIDWEKYKNKKEYFENKKCTMVHY